MKFRFYIVTLSLTMVLVGLMAVGCSDDDSGAGPTTIDYDNVDQIVFSEHVLPLLTKYALTPAGAALLAEGVLFDSWDNLIRGGNNDEALIPFDSENSVMIELLTKLVDPSVLPAAGGEALTDAEQRFLIRWIDEGAKNDAGEVPYENSTNRLFVCSQNDAIVSVIDVDAQVVIRNVKFAEGSSPHYVVVDPDGIHWYVTLINGGRVIKMNSDYEEVASAEVGSPALMALQPDGNLLYVSRFMNQQNPSSSIFVVDRTTMAPVTAENIEDGELPVLLNIPHGIAINNDGSKVFTASIPTGQLITITTADNSVATTDLSPVQQPLQVRVSPVNNNELYVSAQGSGEVIVLNAATNPPVIEERIVIGVGSKPWHPVFTADGRTVYIGNNGASTVSVINADTRAVEQTIDGNGLANCHGSAISSDGRFLFISNQNVERIYTPRYDFGDNEDTGTVVVIDISTNEIVKVLEIERFGTGMGISG